MKHNKLPIRFYKRQDVVIVARELIGKVVVTNLDGLITSGRIVETEAYVAHIDKASHSFGGRRTAKNEHMYASAGTAYVYICYGMHQMLNVVTNEKDVPDAVLVRALEPLEGVDIMLQRTGKPKLDFTLTKGPGNVGKALGIFKKHSGLHLLDDEIYLVNDGFKLKENEVGISKRIGVESAFPDSELPYRFYIRGNKYVSGRNK
jgi:DNA-3-methyladenine glycosylase